MPQSNPPPSLPEIHDEAGKSPRWVPALGIGLFVLLAVVLVARLMTQHKQPTAAPSANADESSLLLATSLNARV